MAREFTKNMFIMLIAIMVGVIIITYFIADIFRQSQIEMLTIEHESEILTLTQRNENFTDNFLQGSMEMDGAREIREIGNYHFDFALFWYVNAVSSVNDTVRITYCLQCIDNCTVAMVSYLESYDRFDFSKPYFETAKTFTSRDRYLELLSYYISFAQAGMDITILRYESSMYLKQAAENLSLGQMDNASDLMELFNLTEFAYNAALGIYDEYKDHLNAYLFFSPIREEQE